MLNFSCYEVFTAGTWNIKLPKDTTECLFTIKVLKRNITKRRSSKTYNLSLARSTITSYTVIDSILISPPTAFGKAILHRTFDKEALDKFKDTQYTDFADYVNENIQVYPKFLITPENNSWYKWHYVTNEPIVRSSLIISTSDKRSSGGKSDIHNAEKLTRFVDVPDYRRYLKNFKGKGKNKEINLK